uniref:Uncharacterized protein LOC114345993 n=1 Tax=Diabrotica virgifera virgifera TaxID=50390 RepID=A0A6P7GRY5_DIAVI
MDFESISFIPKLAFDYLSDVDRCYKERGSFGERDLENLHSFFGDTLVLATELVDKCKIIEYKLQDGIRNVFKIISYTDQYTLYDNINFCHCNYFRSQVLEARDAITCKHVLAVRLGKITGKTTEEIVTPSQLVDFLNEQINYIGYSNEY